MKRRVEHAWVWADESIRHVEWTSNVDARHEGHFFDQMRNTYWVRQDSHRRCKVMVF